MQNLEKSFPSRCMMGLRHGMELQPGQRPAFLGWQREPGGFAGPASRSGSLLSMLPSLSFSRGGVGALGGITGTPTSHPAPVFQVGGPTTGGIVLQHPKAAASAAPSQPRNRAEQSEVLTQCLRELCFKGLRFFTSQSSQAGGNAKRWLCKLLLPAAWRNWD